MFQLRSIAVNVEDGDEVMLNASETCNVLTHIAPTMYDDACDDTSSISVVLRVYVL